VSGSETPFLPPNWKELEPLLDELLDTPAEERADRVVEMSHGNPTLQRQLEQLLAEVQLETPMLDQPADRRFIEELAKEDPVAAMPEVFGSGRYRTGKELGRGGMASVYLARDLKHGRDVAIKIIRSDLSASLGHERFLREIEIAARLRHPNIVPLYDSGEVNGLLYFVMPYEEGQSLRERVRRDGPLPIIDALNVLRDVVRALAYAHEHGVVHRDIKPDNVMLSSDAAVVTDFGIAKAVSVALTESRDATLTQAGTVIGTPAYMAPEQATGDAAIDHRADIYSFGCLGYELFTGHPPFREQTTHLLIAAHIATVPRPITEIRADVPPAVADLLAHCLAKDPANRPQSARELLPFLDGATSTGGGVSTTGRRDDARPSSRWWKWPAVSLAAAAMVIAVYFATRTASAAAPITVAVLPFGNTEKDSTMDFVVDGLAEEVASALGRVPGILIKSRSGARAYRGQWAPDVTEAGARLKADYLVTAVARQDRGRWILSAEFERAADARSLWSDIFVVNPNEQAAAVDSIAGRLAAELRLQFPRAIGIAPMRSPTERTKNNEAYRLYLRGQEKLNRRGQSVREATELFQQAIQLDSLYAPSYSGLSMALALQPWFHKEPAPKVRGEIVAAARRALALDPTLSLPHVALGVSLWQAFEWAKAATEFETSIRLDPRNVEARVQYARLLYSSGRHAEALVQLREARNLDPASALVLSHSAYALYGAGQLDSAVAEIRRAIGTDSTNMTTVLVGAWVYLAKDRPGEAHALTVRLPNNNEARGYLLAKSGDEEGAREMLRRLDTQPRWWGDETQRAFIYLALGDTAKALSGLERGTDAKEIWPLSLQLASPAYDPIRRSARFRGLLKRVGLGAYPESGTRQ